MAGFAFCSQLRFLETGSNGGFDNGYDDCKLKIRDNFGNQRGPIS